MEKKIDTSFGQRARSSLTLITGCQEGKENSNYLGVQAIGFRILGRGANKNTHNERETGICRLRVLGSSSWLFGN